MTDPLATATDALYRTAGVLERLRVRLADPSYDPSALAVELGTMADDCRRAAARCEVNGARWTLAG